MASSDWINLSRHWRLQDVQAALNVLITSLGALGVFACARFCWQSSVIQRDRQHNIPISSLLSINTFGEAVDVLWLLKARILHRRHIKILIQACLAIILSVAAVLSGPIARYSTNVARTVVALPVPGLIAYRREDSILNAPVIWNQTMFSVERAGFPYDQLLDYLPDPLIDWTYNPSEWNSTWAMQCNDTNQTSITLEDVGGNCSVTLYELPGLQKIISLEKYSADNVSDWWGGEYDESGRYSDILLCLGAAKVIDRDNVTGKAHQMTLDLAAIHMHNLSIQQDSDSSCFFGEGPVGSASYTKTECTLTRRAMDPSLRYIAFPDTDTPWLVSRALAELYLAQFIQESIRGTNFTVITPNDLKRFYQIWVATKDTQEGYPVTRTISVHVPVVQLSTAFLVICLLVFLLIAVSLGSYILNYLRNRKTFEDVPQSKLEWMLRVVQAAEEDANPGSTAETSYDLGLLKRSRTSRLASITSSVQLKGEKRRIEFENARYSDATSSVKISSSTEAFSMAEVGPVVYPSTPAEWQIAPLKFEAPVKETASSAYTSISEFHSWRSHEEASR